MNIEKDKYLEKIKTGIIGSNQLGILDVTDIVSIKTSYFDSNEYPTISNLLKNGNIALIKEWATNKNQGTEYLDILLFNDQNEKKYLVSIYDSIELWQDPEIIEIIPL